MLNQIKNGIKKTISLVLASSVFANSLGAFASSSNSLTVKYPVLNSRKSNGSFKKILNDHPIVTTLGALVYCDVDGYKGYCTRSLEAEKGLTNDERLERIYSLMKNEIILTASEEFDYDGNGQISEYGETDAGEWFAEVCAHAFCSSNPNKLGQAMLKFLEEQNKNLRTASVLAA